MVSLHKKHNKFSIHAMRGSELVEIDNQPINGVRIHNMSESSGYELETLDGKLYKISDDNFDIIIRSSIVNSGTLVGNFTWQDYKNKWMFLPEGLLDGPPIQYGDIVEPVVYRQYFGPSEMIYLGVKDIVNYSQTMYKQVKKQSHIFVGLDDNTRHHVYDYQNINSAYFKKSSDISLADDYLGKINSNQLPERWPYFTPQCRTFYLDTFRKTKIKPILVKLTPSNQVAVRNGRQTCQVAIEHNGKFYLIESASLAPQNLSSVSARELSPMEVDDSGDITADLNNVFISPKFVSSNVGKLVNVTVTDYYAVVYELYQNGVLNGRK